MLDLVASGAAPETFRLYRPDDVLAFSSVDAASAGFGDAVAAARVVGFEPVLRLAGQTISPRLQEASVSLHYAVSRVVVPPGVSVPSSRLVAPAACHGESVSASPNAPREDNMRWAWDTKFLGALTVTLRYVFHHARLTIDRIHAAFRQHVGKAGRKVTRACADVSHDRVGC